MAVSLPALSVQAQFTPGTWTDISAYVLNLQVTRPSTRLQGPIWQYQAGTAAVVLDNSDGRFDPDNLAGPYTSSTGLRQVVWIAGPGQTKTWMAPANLSGSTIKVECWGPGAAGATGTGIGVSAVAGVGGGGGEYAAENAWVVTPRVVYPVVTDNTSSRFNSTAVVAHAASGTTGGTGSSNSIHFNGGAGAAGGTTANNTFGITGGGGGSSGGTAATGNAGTAGNSGGAGGIPPAGAYGGGAGANGSLYRGQSGQGPGGGGGGGGVAPPIFGIRGGFGGGGPGKGGQVRLTYFVTITPSATVTQVLPRVPVQVTATWGGNFLNTAGSGSVHNDDFEGTLGTWTQAGNCTIADTAAQAHSGTNSMQMTSAAAGNMSAAHCAAGNIVAQGMPVYGGQQVNGVCWFRSATMTTRSCQMGFGFYDAAGNSLGNQFGPAITDSGTAWTRADDGGNIIAPAGAARCRAFPLVQATAAASEVHYADDSSMSTGTYALFNGFADSWTETPVTYSAGYSEFTLSCTDGFKVLSQNTIPATTPVGALEDSGSRIDRILDVAGWYPGAGRQLDAGDTNQQATTFGSDALSLLQLTADTEIGQLYVNGSGQVVFRHRQAVLSDTRSNIPQAVFGDVPGTSHAAGTEFAFAAVGRADDDTTLANDIQITAAGSANLQEATDPVSVYVNQERSYARTDLLLPDDGTAFQYAGWVLFISKDAENRFDTLTLDPLADTVNLWPQVLGRDVGDRIQVWRRPSGVAAPVTKDMFIRGITHVHNPGDGSWQTTWTLQSALKYGGFLILDSATSGLLDVDALAY